MRRGTEVNYKQIRAYRLAMGVHPLCGEALGPNVRTCGECCHQRDVMLAGTYHKCGRGPLTHGPATDVRMGWPACEWFEAAEPAVRVRRRGRNGSIAGNLALVDALGLFCADGEGS
jgi:hypothetical protein